jgi:inosine-uridine nucleoside N-ribohydrolase
MPKIILDTDIGSDVDDAMALLFAFTLQNWISKE